MFLLRRFSQADRRGARPWGGEALTTRRTLLKRVPPLLASTLLLAGVAAAILAVTAEREVADGRLLFGTWRTRHLAAAGLLLVLSAGAACAHVSRHAVVRYVFALLQAGLVLLLMEAAGLSGLVSYPQLLGNVRLLPTNDLALTPVPHLNVRGETYMDTAIAWGLPHDPIAFHYVTDRYGFRNPSDPGSAEIYLLGDSVLVGGLVPFEETVAAELARSSGRSVMNVALIGIGPQEEHELFRAAGFPVVGRRVLQFVFEGNDLEDSATFRRGRTAASRRNPSLKDRSFTQNAVLALQRLTQPIDGLARRRTCEIGGQIYTFGWATNSHLGLEAEQARIFSAIERFAVEIEAGGGDFTVVFVPAKLRVLGPLCESWPVRSDLRDSHDSNPLWGSIRAWGETARIPLIDLTPALERSARQGAIPWIWGDTHWNATGHAVAARAISYAQSPSRPIDTDRWGRQK